MELVDEVNKLRNYFDRIDSVRENLVKRSRDFLQLCRRVVHGCVKGDNVDALVMSLENMYRELVETVRNVPELLYSGLFYSIASEYVEAMELYSIIKNRELLGIERLDVHPIPFVLGLADLIGELKRVSLEYVRLERYREAMEFMEIAENIYDALSSLSYTDAVIPGFRRKIDVYRKVIDDWKELMIDLMSRYELKNIIRRNV
ncbi:Translin [Ignisphaera aggregans DSM 17230]|uniref:Translin n=1 Tax=Ignisphaera aggregans (strain DSM 17230 / JCM 13409 / AQ1.S1) TaxID=583356 RepID=E0SNI1_IGNAA|nr:Translin [Ignisphaera aggregans DSM 17230]